MSSSRLLSLMLLLSFSLLFQLSLGANPFSYSCYGSGNFTSNGDYNKNLDTLLTTLDTETPTTGFADGSLGQSPNQTYGLALCRGDINTTYCQACVDEATNEIQNVCQLKYEAVIWYDVCQVKYSNLSFLGNVSTQEWSSYRSTANASNPVNFNETVVELLSQLKENATGSPNLYAAGQLGIGNSTTVYGYVQCTGDLSGDNCATCIDFAFDNLLQFSYGREGGRFLGESCDVRYEVYPFILA